MAERLVSSEMQTVPRSESANASAHVGMAARIAALDWSKTGPDRAHPGLGNPKAAVGLILPAQAEIVLFWGAQFIAICNDAYAPTIGEKHRARLAGRRGRTGKNCGTISSRCCAACARPARPSSPRTVRSTSNATAIPRPFISIFHSPVRGDDESIDGVLCIVAETTRASSRSVNWRARRALDAGAQRRRHGRHRSTGISRPTRSIPDAYFAEKFSPSPRKGRTGRRPANIWQAFIPTTSTGYRPRLIASLATGERYAQ